MFTMPIIDMEGTGKNIEKLRKEKNMSVKDLQDIFGFSTPNAIYKWQRGVAMPTIDNLIVLSFIFQVPVDGILIVDV